MDAATIQIYGFLGAAPVYLVLLAGFVMCLRSYGDRPAASLLTGAAILIVAGTRFMVPNLLAILYSMFFRNGPPAEIQVLVSSVMYSIPGAVAYGLLFWVIFALKEAPRWRSEAGPPP